MKNTLNSEGSAIIDHLSQIIKQLEQEGKVELIKIDELKFINKKIHEMIRWIPIKEAFPDGEALLLTTSKIIVKGDWYQGKWRVIGMWDHNGKEWVSGYKTEDITHWKKLPSVGLF